MSAKDEIMRLKRDMGGKMQVEDELQEAKSRIFNQKLKLNELANYNAHLEKYNEMLKRNDEE